MCVSYIDYLNAFHRWLENHYLPAASQLLYFRLLDVFNRCGWAEWVSADEGGGGRLQGGAASGAGKAAGGRISGVPQGKKGRARTVQAGGAGRKSAPNGTKNGAKTGPHKKSKDERPFGKESYGFSKRRL